MTASVVVPVMPGPGSNPSGTVPVGGVGPVVVGSGPASTTTVPLIASPATVLRYVNVPAVSNSVANESPGPSTSLCIVVPSSEVTEAGA